MWPYNHTIRLNWELLCECWWTMLNVSFMWKIGNSGYNGIFVFLFFHFSYFPFLSKNKKNRLRMSKHFIVWYHIRMGKILVTHSYAKRENHVGKAFPISIINPSENQLVILNILVCERIMEFACLKRPHFLHCYYS